LRFRQASSSHNSALSHFFVTKGDINGGLLKHAKRDTHKAAIKMFRSSSHFLLLRKQCRTLTRPFLRSSFFVLRSSSAVTDIQRYMGDREVKAGNRSGDQLALHIAVEGAPTEALFHFLALSSSHPGVHVQLTACPS
jgi:hypothetical protein